MMFCKTAMSNYPSTKELKKMLQKNIRTTKNVSVFLQEVSETFGNTKISCNHRVPQLKVRSIAQKLNVEDEVALQCASVICKMVDQSQCYLK